MLTSACCQTGFTMQSCPAHHKFGPGSAFGDLVRHPEKNLYVSYACCTTLKLFSWLIIGRLSVQIPKKFPAVMGQALSPGAPLFCVALQLGLLSGSRYIDGLRCYPISSWICRYCQTSLTQVKYAGPAMSQKAGNRMLLNPGKSAKDVSIAHTYRNNFIGMRMHPG